MRVHRLISILLLVESNGTMKAKELAEKLETSVRTIYRDIDILCEAGFPLITSTGPKGGIQFIDGYSVDIEKLHSDDFIPLYLSGTGILPDKQSHMGLKLSNTLLKLEKNLPSKFLFDLEKAKKRFHFDVSPWWGEKQTLRYMDLMINSVWKHKKINISYEKANGDISKRRIQPYGIVVKRVNWYLIAYCEEKKEIRTFRCERVTKVEVTEEYYSVPEQFSLEEHWKSSEKQFKINRTEIEVYLVRIKLQKRWIPLLEKLEVVEFKQNSEEVSATINMFKYEYACQDIMEFIGCVEVLEPFELREYIKNEVSNLLLKY
ncbi:helix-turn-helix transcriptional regulator [Chengkuizengella axinellae]|uniref:WYL domain-containing protein n=1 Tax=Chengkuizengella axinellae TaxID=3064388 RepID=A0ABT9IWA3_9BACL|nr:WYL domain-containing protein [Chengkuizengella sp. 2205SS18-9]MDP5273649.1 WYL domain-containing protein [Chengkuizengella sp. 2205SS18-9]